MLVSGIAVDCVSEQINELMNGGMGGWVEGWMTSWTSFPINHLTVKVWACPHVTPHT